MRTSIPLVVFSDLDGTLLDHRSYSWEPAKPALNLLAGIGAPVVLSSSKTAAEIEVLQAQIGLTRYPAIVENGAGLVGLSGAPAEATEQYAMLRAALGRVRSDLRDHFTGFGDMNVGAVAQLTGLPKDAAGRARMRAFSEPGLWSGSKEAQSAFITELAKHGIAAQKGGRFLTLSFGKTKADRMADVIARYRPEYTIALGDAPNDVEMLDRADFGAIVANPDHAPLPCLKGEADGRIFRTREAGPRGWNAAMIQLLDRLDLMPGDQAHG